METRIRLRLGDAEVECVGEEEFVIDRLPKVLANLIRELRGEGAAPVPRPPAPLAPVARRLLSIAGEVRDYWTGVTVAGASVSTSGLTPEIAAEADEAGRFVISGQSLGPTAVLIAGSRNAYVETWSGPFDLSPGTIMQTASIVPQGDLRRQYAQVGRTLSRPEAAAVIVELMTAAGTPLEMVSAADLSLLGDIGVGYSGPFFFGPGGDVAGALLVSQAFDGRARALFLEVPPGDGTLVLTAPGESGALQRVSVPVTAPAYGATIANARLPA